MNPFKDWLHDEYEKFKKSREAEKSNNHEVKIEVGNEEPSNEESNNSKAD